MASDLMCQTGCWPFWGNSRQYLLQCCVLGPRSSSVSRAPSTRISPELLSCLLRVWAPSSPASCLTQRPLLNAAVCPLCEGPTHPACVPRMGGRGQGQPFYVACLVFAGDLDTMNTVQIFAKQRNELYKVPPFKVKTQVRLTGKLKVEKF